MRKARYEVSTVGIDEALQGLTSDHPGLVNNQPYPLSTGLRIPPILPGDTGAVGRTRYLFLLATKVHTKPWMLRGIRQGLTIGFNGAATSEGFAPEWPIELPVTTPTWRFPDGNVSWHLVWEHPRKNVQQRPKSDGASLAFVESDTPALLYQSYTNANGAPPPYYNIGLTAYSPPKYTANWQPLAGLGCFYDLRFPWNDPHETQSLELKIEGNARVSLYASVLQSDSSSRPTPAAGLTAVTGVMSKEDSFVVAANAAGFNPNYYRVFGSLICEDLKK